MIQLDEVVKHYRFPLGRTTKAVDGVTLRMEAGEVLGLAGPNGAGKSTLIALLLGFLRPTSGDLRIAGLEPRVYVQRHGVGYLSELVAVNPRWRTDHALRRYAVLAGVPAAELGARVDAVIGRLGLAEHRDKRVKALSKGNLQRMGLAQALLGEERVLILDEPTHGMDPVWTQRFRDIVLELRQPGRTIFIASHNLDELERVCDRVAIIDRGRVQRVVATGRAAPAEPAGGGAYRLAVASGAEHVHAVFQGAVELGRGEFEVQAPDLATLNGSLAVLLQRGALIASVAPSHTALERQFREAVSETS